MRWQTDFDNLFMHLFQKNHYISQQHVETKHLISENMADSTQ